MFSGHPTSFLQSTKMNKKHIMKHKKIKNANTAKQSFLMVFCKSHRGSSSVHLEEFIK